MISIAELQILLQDNRCDFELIEHDTPIVSTQDAARYFDLSKAAPTFIMDTDQGLAALIVSYRPGKLDFSELKNSLGFSKFKMADRDMVLAAIGYKVGSVPLIGHQLPTLFDNSLLINDYVYGGAGDTMYTLKIAPHDLVRLSNVVKRFN